MSKKRGRSGGYNQPQRYGGVKRSTQGFTRYRQSYYPGARRALWPRRNQRTGGYTGLELKFLDSELTSTSLTNAWASYNPTGTGCTDSLSVPVQGNGESERLGRVYTIDSIMIHGRVKRGSHESSNGPFTDIRIRIIVYWDTQTNSAEATMTDIMDAGATDDILAFRNLQNTHRFKLICDKSFLMKFNNQTNEGAVNLFATGGSTRPFTLYHKFKGGLKVQTDGTTANVTSVTDNNIGIGAIAEGNGEGTVLPTIAYTCRVRFRG